MPAPRRSMEWTVRSARATSCAASFASCCEVLRVPWRRSTWRGPVPSTRQPIASPPGRASSPDGSPATSARTASRRSLPEDVRGRTSSRVQAAGTLNPARLARAWAASIVVAGVGRVAAGARSPPPARAPRRRPDAPRRRPPPPPGAARARPRPPSGSMFSPPRTIRSVRRSTTTRRPAASSLPRSPVRTGSSAATGGSPRYPELRDGPRDDDLAHAVRSRIVDAHGHPGERPARRPGRARRLRGRQRRDAGAHLGQAVRRHDRPAGPHGPLDERRRDRPAPEQHRAERRRAAARHGRRRAAGRAGTGRARRGWAAGSTGARGAGAGRRRAGGPGTGTPSRIARHRTPRPATWPSPSGSAQPVAGGRTSSHASALAAIARCDSTTPFGRPVVPEVSTTTAGASGPVSAATSRAGNGASTPPSTTIAGSSSARAVSRSRVVSPAGSGRNRGAHPEQRDDHGDGLGGRRHLERDAIARAHATRVHRARRWRPRARRAVAHVIRRRPSITARSSRPGRGELRHAVGERARSCVVDPVAVERRLVHDDPEPAAALVERRADPPAVERRAAARGGRARAAPAVASPWSRSAAGHPGTSGSVGRGTRWPPPARSPSRTAMRSRPGRRAPRHAMAIAATAPGPPTRAGLTTRTSAAACSTRVAAASGEVTASSAAIGTPTRARSRAVAPCAPTGSGCSTYWIPNRSIARSR